jgi:hypothetical protein
MRASSAFRSARGARLNSKSLVRYFEEPPAASRPRTTSPPPRRCTARWTCGSGWTRRTWRGGSGRGPLPQCVGTTTHPGARRARPTRGTGRAWVIGGRDHRGIHKGRPLATQVPCLDSYTPSTLVDWHVPPAARAALLTKQSVNLSDDQSQAALRCAGLLAEVFESNRSTNFCRTGVARCCAHCCARTAAEGTQPGPTTPRLTARIFWMRCVTAGAYRHRAWAHNPKVAGSNPAPATLDDEGLADAVAANPFALPRLHPGIGF